MDNKLEDFGDLLGRLGSKGKFQKILLYLAVTPIGIIVPILYLGPIFILNVPDHYCYVPGMENFTEEELSNWKNQSLPKEIGPDGLERYSQCMMYNSDGGEINCPKGWHYDRSDFIETMVSEYDWVCSKAHYPTTLFTADRVGLVVGTIIFGILADKIGRRPVLFISMCIYLSLRLVSVFIPQYFTVMVIVTFLSSIGYPMMDLIPTMVLAELCDDEFRSRIYSIVFLVYVIGMAATPYIAYLCSHWYYIALVTILPSYSMFVFWYMIPESPSWLISVGRTKEATVILQRIAKCNGTLDKFSEDEFENILQKISENQRKLDTQTTKSRFVTLLKKTRLLKHLGLITITWVVSNLIYEVITLNTPNMSGDQFLNFFLLAIVEAPASVVGGYSLSLIGRRWTAPIFFFLCSVFCFVGAGFMGYEQAQVVVVIATFISKFAINITYLVMYLQAAELLPTPLRSTGNSFAATISSLFAMLVPSIVYVSNYNAAFPYYLMGGLTVFAMVTSTFLPETIHQDLPETIEDANNFGKGHSYWEFRPVHKRQKINSSSSLVPTGIDQESHESITTYSSIN